MRKSPMCTRLGMTKHPAMLLLRSAPIPKAVAMAACAALNRLVPFVASAAMRFAAAPNTPAPAQG